MEAVEFARHDETAILCKPESSVGLENSILDVVVAVVSSSTGSAWRLGCKGAGGG
jgi:hypothetical protein